MYVCVHLFIWWMFKLITAIVFPTLFDSFSDGRNYDVGARFDRTGSGCVA
jgi:hypothetical protein